MTGVQLAGEPVTMSSAGDLAVSRGRFRLENPGTEAVRAAVDAAFVDVGGRRHRVEPASVFDSGRETGHDPGGFDVAPGTTTFWLSFPPAADTPGAGERTSVVLRLAVEGETLEASSPVTLERRIPRR